MDHLHDDPAVEQLARGAIAARPEDLFETESHAPAAGRTWAEHAWSQWGEILAAPLPDGWDEARFLRVLSTPAAKAHPRALQIARVRIKLEMWITEGVAEDSERTGHRPNMTEVEWVAGLIHVAAEACELRLVELLEQGGGA